ncbi:MAG: hypothetical protein AUH25_02080 [Thaumarchaeota archaeon 13_1_40CM_38_12]|nr:MAG: hypothetical protein AUH25_02080 [Thaumarchaeota archaeon 13_1_40CM_38_12]
MKLLILAFSFLIAGWIFGGLTLLSYIASPFHPARCIEVCASKEPEIAFSSILLIVGTVLLLLNYKRKRLLLGIAFGLPLLLIINSSLVWAQVWLVANHDYYLIRYLIFNLSLVFVLSISAVITAYLIKKGTPHATIK